MSNKPNSIHVLDSSARRHMKLLLITLITLVAADGVISQFLIRQGFAREGKPFLQTWIGDETFLIIKTLGAGLAAFLLWKIYQRRVRPAMAVTLVSVVLYIFVVFWSLIIYLHAA